MSSRTSMIRSTVTMSVCVVFFTVSFAHAGVTSTAVRETAELVLKKFGVEIAEEGLEALSRKIARLAGKYGDDAFVAFQKVGPRLTRIADDAGEHAATAIHLLAKHGDDGVRLIVRPKQIALAARFGDDAADVLLRHGDAVEPVVDAFGVTGARALKTVSTQNGRRLAILTSDGVLSQAGKADELLRVVARYGDSGADFIWRNKGALTVGATLSAFLADPGAFIKGGNDLAKIGADSVISPVMRMVTGTIIWIAAGMIIVVMAAGLVWTLVTPRRLKVFLVRAVAAVAQRCFVSYRK